MTPSKKTPAKVVKQDNGAKAPQYENKILDTSSIGVLITRISDGTILYANQAIANLLGIPDIGPVIGAPVPNFYWDPEERLVVIQRFRAEGSISQYPLRTRRADDSMLWVTISIQPFNFEGEQVLLTEIVDISERKQTEEALRQTQSLYQSLVEASPMSICRKDLAGRFTFANQRFLELSQTTLADLVGKTDFDLHPSELADKYRRDDLAVMESGQVEEFVEERMVHEGETAYVETIKTPTYDGDGKVDGIQISFWDVTDRKQAEQAQKESEERFKRFTEATVEGLVFHEQGRIIDANPALLTMFGLSNKDLMGSNLLDFIVPESHNLVMQQMQLESVQPYEIQGIRKDGSTFPIETSTRAYKDGERVIRASSIRDITERKQAQAALLESEERFRRFTEATNEGLVFHEQGRIIDANPAGLAMFGLSDFTEFVGKSLMEFVVPEFHQTILKQMQLENVNPYEIQCIRKDHSTFPVETSTRTYKIGDKTVRATSIRDVSERKQAEAELRQNELLLSNAIHIAQMGYWDLDIDTQMFIFNDQYYRTFHATTTEEMGGNQMSVMDFIQRFIPPGEGDIIGSSMQEAIETKDPNFQAKIEAQNLTVQGELRWVSVWLTVEKDEHGRTIKLHGVNQDITERKQAERKLQENQQLLQLVMDNIPQAVFWKDKELTYLGANQAFTEDAGFTSPQELVGKNDFDMPWKEQAELYRADDQQVLDIGEAKLNYEEPQTGPTGKVTWLRTSKIPMRDGDGKVFAILGMYEDITEWKRLQQQVQEGFERRGYQVQIGTEISQEVAAASQLNDLFDRVVTLTKERLGYYHTQLLHYDDARDAVVLINGYGEIGQKMLADGHQMPMGEGLIGTAAASGETVLRPTLADDPDWHSNPLLPDTQGEIAVPIKWQNTVLGVLDVQSDQAGALSDEDRLLLEGICGQIAIAMHSAELVEVVRQNEAKLAEALRTARLANWEYDVEKDIFIFNDQFYSIFHTTAEKAGGYQLSSARYAELFVHPDDLEFVRKEIGRSLSSTERVFNNTVDHRILYGDGGIGYITAKVTVERDENGKITRYYGANQDITERKQAEEALRINETRLAEALRAARLGNWEYDFANDLFIFTDDFYSIFRTSAEKVGGYKISSADYSRNFVHPDDASLVGIEIQKVLDAKDRLFTTHLEHRIIFSDGEVGHIAVNINVERDENGKITRWYGANQDITERKQAEEALRINEALLAEALEIARLAHWEYDVEKDIFTFNDQFYSLFHATAEQHGGYQLPSAYYAQHFVYSDDLPVVGVEIEKALNSTERHYSRDVEHRFLYADGGLGHMQVNINVERDENGKITRYYGANQDITERTKVQHELAERLEEINRLYQNLSHEGWKNYRNTADLPTGFMHDQTGVKPVDEAALTDEPFDNIPIRVLGGEVVGTLTVANDPRNPTSPEDVTFLQQVSDQIALALESARLSAQTQSALAQSEKLFEASRTLTQATDLQELTSSTVSMLGVQEINRAILTTFNYDSEGNIESLDIIANWWNGTGHETTAIGTHYPIDVIRAMSFFVSPTPVFFNDTLSDERVDSTTLKLVQNLNLRAVAVLPLHTGTRQIGALILEAEEPHDFTNEEIRLFSALAPQISTVLENRRQFERAQQQAQRESTLNVISQKIQSATTVEAVLQIAARELGHALGAPMTIAQLSMKDKK